MGVPPKNIESKELRVSFTSSKRKKVNKLFILIEGSLIIRTVEKLKKSLVDSLNLFDVLAIKLENIEEIDTSGIQLLYYISSVDPSKEVFIDSNLSNVDQVIVSAAGFSPLLNKPKLS